MKLENLLPQNLITAGLNLYEYTHADEFCWKYPQILEIIQFVTMNKHAILGGDVMNLVNGKIEYNYSNWFINRKLNQNWELYVQESYSKAIEYIENYPDNSKYLFTITICDETEYKLINNGKTKI